MKALSRDVPLKEDVDLRKIAEDCTNFTGADLKALLYNAQLQAAHEALRITQEEENSKEDDGEEEEEEDTTGLEADSETTLPETLPVDARNLYRVETRQPLVFKFSGSSTERQHHPQLENKAST